MKSHITSVLIFLAVFTSGELTAQQSIDQLLEFPAGSGTYRKYSLYIPTNYNVNNPNRLMIGFHPLNIGTWSGKTWRDTLISFAEANSLLLACPDGGTGGRTDDLDDYAFTLALMDSMLNWYNVDTEKVFAIGFSVGGKAVYEFCLEHHYRFKGCIPIGAAVTGTSSFDQLLPKAKCLNFYLVHGDQDSPNNRYYPVKTALEQNNGNVEGLLMAGIGHTINFPSRNTILKNALLFIDSTSCDFTGVNETGQATTRLFPNPVESGQGVFLASALSQPTFEIISATGQRRDNILARKTGHNAWKIDTANLKSGFYLISVRSGFQTESFRLLIK